MTDRQVQEDVHAALDWEPSVDATAIGVTVAQGIVTLRGDVKSYSEKSTAERVALGVYGVRAVANELLVRISGGFRRTDSEIGLAAANALTWSAVVPENKAHIAVANGWVTLTGELDWYYQSRKAEHLVRDLLGVVGVTNRITLKPRVSTTDVENKIAAALKRSAEVDAKRIHVGAQDGQVTLTGTVRSWAERQEAERAAWSAPGVKLVDDRIAVTP